MINKFIAIADKMAIEITIQQWEQANKNIMKGNSKGGDNLPGYSY